MAGETPHETPYDAGSTDAPTQAADSGERQTFLSFLRRDLQSLAIAWGGGWFFGLMFVSLAFTVENANTIAGVVAGTFLMIAPGSYATWETWRGYRYSTGKDRRKSRAGESQNAG